MNNNKIPELRPYQTSQNNAIRQSFQKGNRRVISCMATGSGKSLMIADLVSKALAKMKRVIIVLPRRSLVRQLSKSFMDWGINHGVVMSGVSRFTMPRCQIISIDTYMARVASGRMELIDADFLIVDECNIQFSSRKLELFSKYNACVGFTATPVAPKKQPLNLFYQEIIETISMQELIDQGYLTPLKFFAKPGIDLSGLKTDADGDYRESQLGGVMDKPQLVGDIFQNWKRLAENKPTVIFASSQSHALHLCEEFNSHGYRFDYLDCTFKDEDRLAIFDRVKNGQTIGIANFGIVSIGIDIPNLECVVMARPTKLISNYLQWVGRVTRLYPGKEFSYVIDHAGIIEHLGLATDKFEWTLDGKETVEERKQKEKEESKEPKEIICESCGTVFKSRMSCPECGHEMVKRGQKIPVHEAKLQEVKKVSTLDKNQFYSELLGYCRRKGKPDSFALALYKNKIGTWPYAKYSIVPSEPSQEVLNYIKSRMIAYAKARA